MTKKNEKKNTENTYSERLRGTLSNVPPVESWLDRRLTLAQALHEMTEGNISAIKETREALAAEFGTNWQSWIDAIRATPAFQEAERNGEEVEKIYNFMAKLLYAYEVKDNAHSPALESEKVFFPEDDSEDKGNKNNLKDRCAAFCGAFAKMVDGYWPVLHWGVRENSEMGIEFKKVI